jgi:hypothetical protein
VPAASAAPRNVSKSSSSCSIVIVPASLPSPGSCALNLRLTVFIRTLLFRVVGVCFDAWREMAPEVHGDQRGPDLKWGVDGECAARDLRANGRQG